MRGRRWLGVLRGNEEDGEFLGGGLGALFLLRRGVRAGTGGQTGYAPEREADGVRAGTGGQTGYVPEREGRRGTRRNGAQTDERAGVENEAQGLKPGEGEKQGTGSIRGEILKAFSAQVA